MKLGSTEVAFNHLRREGVSMCNVVVKGKIYQGIAKCSHGDDFSREEGRKIAMTKALSKTNNVLTKKQRSNVWEDYRNLPANPRW